jgi:hypothetical protein
LNKACAGGSADAAKVAWEYPGTATSMAAGGFRISADGSRVVNWGYYGVHDVVFTEVDVHKNVLREFYFTNNTSYRTVKLPLSAFDLDLLRSTAGL